LVGHVIYTAAVQSLGSRWHALDRGARATLIALAALTAGAVAVRVWLMSSYGPAFLGFPDSAQYELAAATGIFSNTQHPAGYPFFLRLVHHLSDEVSFTIAVQHVMGVAGGLLLYKAVRRTGAPAWLGLLPAAVVFFGGTGLILEQSLLADSVLAFLQAVGVYFAIRALYDPSLRWPLLAGIAIGLSFWTRTVALSSAILIPLVLLCAAVGGTRRRLLSALTAALVVLGMIGAYVAIQDYFTGYLGYERQSSWNLYGRVATFVDCSSFTPPRGTRFLCPPEPLGHRSTENYYQYASTSPAVKHFGPPYAAPFRANAILGKFSFAVIEDEPTAYLEAIVRGLGFYIFPRAGEGYTPPEMREAVIEPGNAAFFRSQYAAFYPSDSLGYLGQPGPLATYERLTRIQGALLILLLAVATAGSFFLPRRMRGAAAVFTLTAIFSITFAIAGDSYDARFAYPTFGPLAAGAALGAWAIGSRLAGVVRRRDS
jgi:hypothetical protein